MRSDEIRARLVTARFRFSFETENVFGNGFVSLNAEQTSDGGMRTGEGDRTACGYCRICEQWEMVSAPAAEYGGGGQR